MSRSLRRGALAATLALSIAPLAACGAGYDSGTDSVRPDNAYARTDGIEVQNVNVVIGEAADGPASVTARIFNDSGADQTLEAILLGTEGGQFELLPPEGESAITVPAGGSVMLGGEGNPAAYVPDASAAGIAAGNAQNLVFLMSESGEAELFARVVPATGPFAYYADWGPTEPPAEETAEEQDQQQETEQQETQDTGTAGEESGEDTGTGEDGGAGEDAAGEESGDDGTADE
ncbi:hypothetical protein [Streptomyces aidingensis]|uniref:DUF461 domain-containing protein n=1 Tax=Streptomyces aidingensis TaxID=910347 RepID=A0A1I1HMK3_9ACTN|nr:hypothetical protein [Streptomyces aidingensis]SFC24792.1 hypothetical protein SAMN05421773_102439 [Streptomyces aidingensis]